MATRSLIAVKTNNTFENIYCHWDGDPDNMLGKLKGYYGTPEKVKYLLIEGDRATIEPWGKIYENPSKQAKNLPDLKKQATECNAEWAYLYDNECKSWQHFETKNLKW